MRRVAEDTDLSFGFCFDRSRAGYGEVVFRSCDRYLRQTRGGADQENREGENSEETISSRHAEFLGQIAEYLDPSID